MNHKIKFILVKELGSVEIVEDMPEADILKMLQS
jgi:3-dehydroquinate synthetase